MKRDFTPRIETLEERLAPAGIVAVDDSNNLITFDSATPGSVTVIPITGLLAAEKIKGVDFRPATGQLYGLGINNVAGDDEGRIYIINPATGVATQVGAAPFSTTLLDNDDYGFDFNPAADRIRVVTDRDENMRVNPNNGTLAGLDTAITPTPSSALIGVAYDRNFDGAPATTLFGIDLSTDSLVRIGGVNGFPSANGGVLTTIGVLGVNVDTFKAGFDIDSRSGTAYAALHVAGSNTGLYTVNLTTGVATLVGAIGGNPALNGLTVVPPDDLTIVNNTTASYIDADGDKVTIQFTGMAAGAALSKADFGFAVGQFGSQLRLINLADDGSEWAHANITINAVPVGTHGDSFATVGYIRATGIDLGKVSINGDLGSINCGNAADPAAGLASLTVQSFGQFTNSQFPVDSINHTSAIVGKLGSLTVKADFVNAFVSVTGSDGSIGPVIIGGNVDGSSGITNSGIKADQSIGNLTINGSVFGGSFAESGLIRSGTTMGNVIIGGSIFGGTVPNTGVVESGTTMGSVLVKGSIYGGTDDHTGTIHSSGNMGNVVVKGSIIGGTVVDALNDIDSGLVYSFGMPVANMGSVTIGGNLEGSNGQFTGSVFASGTMKAVSVAGSLLGGSNYTSGSVAAWGDITSVTVKGDLIGGSGLDSGSIHTFADGSIGSVTIGGSLLGGQTFTGIISSNQLGAVKITGEMHGGRISGEGDTGAFLNAVKSVSIGHGVRDALILGGYSINGTLTNSAATVGPVTVGGDWITSRLNAGAVGNVLINGDLDGRTAVAASGIFSAVGGIGNLTINGSVFGGSIIDTGNVRSTTTVGNVIVGGSIFGGSASTTGVIESGTTMGSVLVKGSIFGGTDDHTGNIHSNGNMGNVVINGSIIGGTVVDTVNDVDSGFVYAFGVGLPAASMGTVTIGGNLEGSNGIFSGGILASGSVKSVSIAGSLLGSSGQYSGSVSVWQNITSVTVKGDLIGGTTSYSGSVHTMVNGSIGSVTVDGSIFGGNTLTGIISANQLGAVKITGGIDGGGISAEGGINPTTAAEARAITSVSVGGTVQNTWILGGYDYLGNATNPDATIGAVTVGGNWLASNLIAGVAKGTDNFFGTDDDVKISEPAIDAFFSKIASVTIKGYAAGTTPSGDWFGIVAEQVGTVKVGARTVTLAPGTDTVGVVIGPTYDFRVREV